ncbi:hypothetical protein KQI46_16785 [Lysinibacillus capsici]|uniref:hypothetical protein n=1 Tax=Lysinibacillus capsici TaxID=2115968 RepID=UPI001C119030|nr:hypothetical protein [Lysinibacillus capsici]MBU5253548.1 hypothetical protein [Lysinibacillus capsici]
MTDLQEIIASYNEYIYNIPNGAQYIAEQLADGKHDDALLAVQDFSEGMIWLMELKPLLKEHNIELNFPIEQIQMFLTEINEGLSKKDWVLVADLFVYEIKPFFEEQVQIIQ